MGYDFAPRNQAAGDFHLGAFSWPVLLEAFGYLFPAIHNGAQWYMVSGVDERLAGDYPGLLSNDGFRVTADEARTMARMARNFVAVQRSLPEENLSPAIVNRPEGVDREQLLTALMETMSSGQKQWPSKVRSDFLDKFERFAEWADQSGGFTIL